MSKKLYTEDENVTTIEIKSLDIASEIASENGTTDEKLVEFSKTLLDDALSRYTENIFKD